MPQYFEYIKLATYGLAGTALLCWFIARGEEPGSKVAVKLIGYFSGGLCLLCYSFTLALPDMLSPRETVTGPVVGFHAVRPYRGVSYFEFNVHDQNKGYQVLRSHYFDRGFFFGDPLVYDGAIVTANYVVWTGQVVSITELRGRHAGWSFLEDPSSSLAAWVFAFAGVALMVGGALRVVSDRLALPEGEADANRTNSTSTLDL